MQMEKGHNLAERKKHTPEETDRPTLAERKKHTPEETDRPTLAERKKHTPEETDRPSLAQAESTPVLNFAEQYAFTCADTFNRQKPSNQVNVASKITAGAPWSDPNYTPEMANYKYCYPD
jgi:hypothetical protein